MIGGRQGGDIPNDVTLDLSTCVNPYGPPPAVMDALCNIDIEIVRRHPFNAVGQLETLYAQNLKVPVDQLVGTRGASEAIWQLARIYRNGKIALPTPTYTEYVRAFGTTNSDFHGADLVVLSNPRNPTGEVQSKQQLEEAIRTNPDCMFIVDESYADFIDDPNFSLIGTELTNVAVLRSPTKFYGLGGVRLGVVWSRADDLLAALQDERSTWPVSALEVALLEAAFRENEWSAAVREELTRDAEWLDEWLKHFGGIETSPSPMHFRLVTGDIEPVIEHLTKRNIRARVLEEIHGVGQPALRITAPRKERRSELD